jgi:mono/diheme cytochrome c family protein
MTPFRRFRAVTALALLPVLPAPGAAVPANLGAFLDRHCADCHDSEAKKGGLDLTALKFDLANADSFGKWQHILEWVRDGEMPPKKKPQPDNAEKAAFLTALKQPLLKADAADIAAKGRVRSRRLTRTEYEHTLHDLLGIDIPLKVMLPEDRASHGFETVAEGQQLSHHQLGPIPRRGRPGAGRGVPARPPWR